ncbi:MAG: MDR family oxidoreductase [Acidimicrobiales bacterium]
MCAYRAVVASGEGPAQLTELSDEDLPDGDVTVEVAYSSLNYKDGLAVTGRAKIARSFPMVCGIDLAGTVAESSSPEWEPGDEVVVTGWGLSETHPGGYSGRQRLRSEWLVRRPEGLSLAQSMAIGTAGLTAMLCVVELEAAGLSPGDTDSPVLVTGAGGGVGSVAVALLAGLGYQVSASTGRQETHDYLRGLGASDVVDRDSLATDSSRPLDKERWAATVDTVGSTTLASALKQTRYRGAVAACGLAGGNDLPVTVLPFILRGVKLLGVDSVMCPTPQRSVAWGRLATDLSTDALDKMTTVEPFARIPHLAEEILAGQTRGRVVIDVNA